MDWGSVAVAGAVHGAEVGCADDLAGVVEGVDGLVAGRPGRGLFAVFADCCPIIFFDPIRPALGLAHAGWRGTVAGVAVNTLRCLGERYGTVPADVEAIIGPCICGRCYEVGEEVAARFPTEAVIGAGSRLSVDLVRANLVQLEAAGIRPERVTVDGRCTFESTDLPSHRRSPDGRRFGVLVALNP